MALCTICFLAWEGDGRIDRIEQPRPQGFSLKKWVGREVGESGSRSQNKQT